MNLAKFKIYRWLRKKLGFPLEAGGKSFLPEGYVLLVDVEGIRVLRDAVWNLEEIKLFPHHTPLRKIKEFVVCHWLSQLN